MHKIIGLFLGIALGWWLSTEYHKIDGSIPKSSVDGYYYTSPQYRNQDFSVEVYTYFSQEELRHVAKIKGLQNPDTVIAFTDISDKSVCKINIVDPEVIYRPEVYGHEFMHCFAGQFHVDNNSKGK